MGHSALISLTTQQNFSSFEAISVTETQQQTTFELSLASVQVEVHSASCSILEFFKYGLFQSFEQKLIPDSWRTFF